MKDAKRNSFPNLVRKRGRPSKDQARQRNDELLDRSLDLFLEKGFEGTTIELISNSIAMSPRTIYSLYADKEALFREAIERAIDEWIMPIERLTEVEEEGFEDTLLNIARVLVKNQISPSGLRLTRLANVEVFRMPELGAYLWERIAQPALAYLQDLFRRRLLSEGAGEQVAYDAALSFMILVVGGAFQSLTWGQVSREEIDRQIVCRTRLFLYGVGSGGRVA